MPFNIQTVLDMVRAFLMTMTLLLLTVNVNAQKPANTSLDSSTTQLSIKVGEVGYKAILELMKPADVFILHEVAGVYPVILTNDSGQKVCVWNDKVNISSPTIIPTTSLGVCKIYQFRNQIGLGFVDKNNSMIEGTAINSWRLIPYVEK